ncbi:hypothetical protein VTL71DRAFT_8775 [Oculimacula yallundae]|uniref:Uncharacterized protein n=1 Tax=Oculimacula yallundae TaxID=86028 RepID=A0ABR4CYJ4_9HELO
MADFDHDDYHSSHKAEKIEDYRQRYVTTHWIANTKKPDRRRDEEPTLRDRIGPLMVICLAISRIIGSGIFVTPVKPLNETSSTVSSLVYWTAGAILPACGILIYLELKSPETSSSLRSWRFSKINGRSVSAPRSGEELQDLNERHSQTTPTSSYPYLQSWKAPFLMSCIYGTGFIVLGNLSGNSLAFGSYIMAAAGYAEPDSRVVRFIATASLAVAFLVQYFTRRGGILINNFFVILKIAILIVLMFLGLYISHEKPGYWVPQNPGGSSSPEYSTFIYAIRHPWRTWVVSALSVFFSYFGYENARFNSRPAVLSRWDYHNWILLGFCFTWIFYYLSPDSNVPKYQAPSDSSQLTPVYTKIAEAATQVISAIYGNEFAERIMSAYVAFFAFGNIAVMTSAAASFREVVASEEIPTSLAVFNPLGWYRWFTTRRLQRAYSVERRPIISDNEATMTRGDRSKEPPEINVARRSKNLLPLIGNKSPLDSRRTVSSLEVHPTASSGLHNTSLPSRLATLKRALLSIPKEKIWFNQDNNTSISNKLKSIAENTTGETWNWWPLRPRMQNLKEGETRLNWICHCGQHLWAELSIADVEQLRSFVMIKSEVLMNDHYCCRARANWKVGAAVQAAGTSSTTATSHVSGLTTSQIPVKGASMISKGNTRSSSRPGSAAVSGGSSGSGQPTVQGVRVTVTPFPTPELYVIFGVKGSRRTLEIAQLIVSTLDDDGVFFQQLRQQYKRHRGFLRYWLSIWQLSYCDFVKFEKIRADRVIYTKNDLPIDPIYEYTPRPPDVELPPILPHEFELAFSSCSLSCKLSHFHDCIEAPTGTSALSRIPKRTAALELKTSVREPAWGIQAQHSISFVRLVWYHLGIFAGTFGFWAWWQVRHPGDVQSAATPLTVVGLFLSLFWSSSGALPAFRRPSG